MGEPNFSGWLTQRQEFEIASPRLSDLPELLDVAKRLGIDEGGWRSLIAGGGVVCATTSRITGLYLADHYSFVHDGDRCRDSQAARSVLCNRFKLMEENVAFGAEVVIGIEWQGSDLRSHLLRGLLRNVGLRYKHLFRSCRKDDPLELEFLKHEGWRCFQEEDETCYLVLDVAKTLRELATRLFLRFPPEHVRLRVPTQIGRRIS